jgi:beta-ureidopropionase / N-carbamoyl-L-amino-acid hydrolase
VDLPPHRYRQALDRNAPGAMITLEQLNTMDPAGFVAALAGIFEHSPWVPQRVAAARPFPSSIALHEAMCGAVMRADAAEQLALIRAHPELAGRAAIRGDLTAASSSEQKGAGLSACTPEQYQRLQGLNKNYRDRFGFPFVLAVRGHTQDSVIATLAQRVTHETSEEHAVALREICRIARFRLADLVDEALGDSIIAMAEALARFSDDTAGLTCAYLTPSHRATAAAIRDFMLAAGLSVSMDAVGNVVGILEGSGVSTRHLLTGSHYDTVTDAGKFDGRLGILLPIAAAGALRRAGIVLPYSLEIVAFAEEEGVRFKSTFLGSRAVAGKFDLTVLDNEDAHGVSMREAMTAAGHDIARIPGIARDPSRMLGFVEVHIEQGPILLEAGVPVGVVTSIAGSLRSTLVVEGLAGHAGTVPMKLRHDAAAAAAEIVLAVERRCGADAGLVGTVGKLEVPGGAINVIPGRCELSIDIRSGSDALRDAADADLSVEIDAIAARRGVNIQRHRILEAASVPCATRVQADWSASVQRVTGKPSLHLPSGAGHDAMMMAAITDIGMLFVRCGNGGISHHPSETLSAQDAEVAAQVFLDYLQHLKVPA